MNKLAIGGLSLFLRSFATRECHIYCTSIVFVLFLSNGNPSSIAFRSTFLKFLRSDNTRQKDTPTYAIRISKRKRIDDIASLKLRNLKYMSIKILLNNEAGLSVKV